MVATRKAIEDEAVSDARRFGIDEDDIDDLRQDVSGGDDGRFKGVWQVNVNAVVAFLAVASQWRTASLSRAEGPGRLLWIGLDYSAVSVALDRLQFDVTPELWASLTVMEDAAAAALNGDQG